VDRPEGIDPKDDYLFMKWGSGTSNFKPKSASEQQTGTMHYQDSGSLLLNFPSNCFRANLEMIADDKVDCILYWDEKEQCLILEQVSAQLARLEKVKKDSNNTNASSNSMPSHSRAGAVQSSASSAPANGTKTTSASGVPATAASAATVSVSNGAAVAEKAPLAAEKKPMDNASIMKPLYNGGETSDESDDSDSDDSESDSSMDD